ncbi:MAG: Ig-like domain repeat protein, partial [Firmicutes bacterium]|nr:Ig-like domain repeat protein [Bacillota bacterium]
MMLTKRMVTIFAAMCLIISINGIAAPSEDYDTSTTETVTPTENANPQEGSKSSGGGAGGTVMLPAVFEGEITLTADGESGALGSEITLTASVEAGDFDGDAEIIFFVNQNEEIGRKVFDGNDCSMEYTPAQVGEQLFHAEFLIDGEVKAQSENVTYTVEKANNSVTLTISKTTINEGESVTLYAQLQHPIEGGAVFQNGKEKIKTAFFDAVGKAQTTLSELPPGSHSISAVYEGDENYKKSASKPVTLTVLSIDNDLSNIKLSDGRISFDKDKTLYSVDFKDTVNYIKVTPIASHDEATIYVTAYRFSQQLKSGEQSGRIYLDEGRNADINIIVTAQSGDEKVYTISAYREKSKTNSVRGPTIRYRFDRTDAASEITFVDTAFHWAESVVYT